MKGLKGSVYWPAYSVYGSVSFACHALTFLAVLGGRLAAGGGRRAAAGGSQAAMGGESQAAGGGRGSCAVEESGTDDGLWSRL